MSKANPLEQTQRRLTKAVGRMELVRSARSERNGILKLHAALSVDRILARHAKIDSGGGAIIGALALPAPRADVYSDDAIAGERFRAASSRRIKAAQKDLRECGRGWRRKWVAERSFHASSGDVPLPQQSAHIACALETGCKAVSSSEKRANTISVRNAVGSLAWLSDFGNRRDYKVRCCCIERKRKATLRARNWRGCANFMLILKRRFGGSLPCAGIRRKNVFSRKF